MLAYASIIDCSIIVFVTQYITFLEGRLMKRKIDLQRVCEAGNLSLSKFAHLAAVDYRTVRRVVRHLPVRPHNAAKIIEKAHEILQQAHEILQQDADVELDILTYQDPKKTQIQKKEVRS